MNKLSPHLQVAVDIGSREHYVTIGLSEGGILDEFTITHTPVGFQQFFHRIELQEGQYGLPVDVAMEGYNGCEVMGSRSWGQVLQ